MKKFIASATTAFLIVAGSVLGATAANAEEQPVCTPSEAWTEIVADIEHPAVTETVEHEAVTETIEHPAVAETVEHPAVYETVLVSPAVEAQPAVYEIEYEFRHKYDGKKTKWSTNPNWNSEDNGNSKGWYATGKTRNGKLLTPAVPAKDAVYEEQLVSDAWTETIVLEEAYTEVVVITEAWTETIVIKEAYIEVVPDIEHPAVECPVVEPPVEEPPVEEPPVVVPPVVTPEVPVVTPVVVVPTTPIAAAPAAVTPVAVNSEKELAYTGGEDMIPFALGGGVLLLAGMGALLARRRMQSN